MSRRREDELAGKELQATLTAAMEKLPPVQRAALELRALWQGKAVIAEILLVSESHGGVLVYRARRALAKELEAVVGE